MITTFIIVLFIIRSSKALLYYLYLFELKEYRLDRMKVHLSTKQGRDLIINGLTILKVVLVFTLVTGIISPLYVAFTIILIYLFEILSFVKRLVFKQFLFPRVKKRVIGIGVLVIIFGILFFSFFGINLLTIITFDILLFLFTSISAIIINRLFWLYENYVSYKAKKKIDTFSNIKIVGITGSYGKTSTKEFLKTILSQKYSVSSTLRSINTKIGVSEHILSKLTNETDIFIVEMAAYKRGEIKDIINVAHPDIGIITAVGNQHLSLFGTRDNIKKAKFELACGLKKNSTLIINSKTTPYKEYVQQAEALGLSVITIGISKSDSVIIEKQKEGKDNISFDLTYNGNNNNYSINVPGKYNIYNIALSIVCALNLGLTVDEIKKGLREIRSRKKTLYPIELDMGITLVDDTFNASEESFVEGIDYLNNFKGKKYLVLQPLIELGKEAQKVHESIGEKAVAECERVYLTNNNYYDSIIKQVDSKDRGKIQVLEKSKITDSLFKQLKPGDVCLFKGKETEKVLSSLLSIYNNKI